jgi:hypothetical protein
MFSRSNLKIDDPLFGSMELVDDETQYFGTIHFTPLKKEIDIIVFSKLRGPTEKQRILYRQIEQKYFECIEKLPVVIEETFQKERKNFVIRDFSKEFELTGISISYLDETGISWDLEYVTPHVLDGFISINYVNWDPKEVSFVQ